MRRLYWLLAAIILAACVLGFALHWILVASTPGR